MHVRTRLSRWQVRLFLWVLLVVPGSWAALVPPVLAEPPSEPVTGYFRSPQFIRADSNSDGAVDISDAVFSLEKLFSGGGNVACLDAADANGDERLDISDPIYTLSFLFLGAQAPPAPGLECGVDPAPGELGCRWYPFCPDDFPLIVHVLSRITFGPTEELYSRVQTKADLLEYLDEQLDQVPEGYDPAVHEPAVWERIQALAAPAPPGQPGQARDLALARLKSGLVVYATSSRWQLYHVLAQFWNNHFHTQINALVQGFFNEAPRGGPALPTTEQIFQAADTSPADGSLVEAEWTAFRSIHPGAAPWQDFGRETRNDGAVSLQEFLDHRFCAYWKYGRPQDAAAVAAQMEEREYNLYRRLALGRFGDMVEACAKSVAMLIYLNGFENTVRSPNENFAREILELHTLGVDSVYTQRDIEELAKVLTGWTAEWVARAGYAAGDINFHGKPDSQAYPLNLREPPPFRFPTQQFWEDDLYAWGFVVRPQAHDWARKDLFLQRYGGTDSLGNPVPAAEEVSIPENLASRTVASAIAELDRVLDRILSFRDTAKFISTKLIQLFVTDDLSLLEKSQPIPPDLLAGFRAADLDGDGAIERSEWEAPIPLVLPNGRPPQVFERLDSDGDGKVTTREYQEPDLLQACIDAWARTGGSVREVVRTILRSDELLSLKFYRAKVKTPFEVVTSAIRALGGAPTNQHLALTANDLVLAGMELFNFSDPTGESELGFDWMHTIGLLERLKYLNRAANPVSQQESRLVWSPGAFQERWGLDTPQRLIELFALLLHGGDILEEHGRLALDAYQSAAGNKALAAVAYLLSLPQFQKQ
ncbi:MAG: DUF1800 family protein [Planctomycetes bacterium]|nr:DUF1800 family protein [Planctomycetota bacterium]